MSLRKNFDSFTSEHKLRDAQEELTQAVYRFQATEKPMPNVVTLKREMEFLGHKLEAYDMFYSEMIEEYVEWLSYQRYPKPEWE